jgi:hypothetical protein
LNRGFTIENANGTTLSVDVVLKDEENMVSSDGSTDLLVSDAANSKQSIIELKAPFSRNKGMHRTACAKPRDQLVLQVHSQAQQTSAATAAVPVAAAHIGLLTDLFCSAVDICVGGHHHLSQRVESAEECIQMLLLLCCSVKEGDIPEETKDLDPDAYLASTREHDDASDADQGGESLPPTEKARGGDSSAKPAISLRSHTLRSAGAHGKGKQGGAGTKKRQVTLDFKAEDRQDEYAEKLAWMQAIDACRYGYDLLTEENLENHCNKLSKGVRNNTYLF